MALILMEGPDNAGKTTIAHELIDKLYVHYDYFKYSRMREENIDIKDISFTDTNLVLFEYTANLFSQLSNINLIVDRHYVSEYVYGSIYRDMSIQQTVKIRKIDKIIASIPSHLLVICFKDDMKIKDDELYDAKDYELIKNKYLSIEDFTKCNVLFLNTTDRNINNQLEQIQNVLAEIHRSNKQLIIKL